MTLVRCSDDRVVAMGWTAQTTERSHGPREYANATTGAAGPPARVAWLQAAMRRAWTSRPTGPARRARVRGSHSVLGLRGLPHAVHAVTRSRYDRVMARRSAHQWTLVSLERRETFVVTASALWCPIMAPEDYVTGRGEPSSADTGTAVDDDQLARQPSDFARRAQSEDDRGLMLDEVVRAAVQLIPGVDEASISVTIGRRDVSSQHPWGDLPAKVDAVDRDRAGTVHRCRVRARDGARVGHGQRGALG
jgi:hypothetical protein